MLVAVSKTTGNRISNGEAIKDLLGRDWFFDYGHKPALVANLPDGEIHAKRLPTDARSKGFAVAFFPDLEFKEIVEQKADAKPATKKFTVENRRKVKRTS